MLFNVGVCLKLSVGGVMCDQQRRARGRSVRVQVGVALLGGCLVIDIRDRFLGCAVKNAHALCPRTTQLQALSTKGWTAHLGSGRKSRRSHWM